MLFRYIFILSFHSVSIHFLNIRAQGTIEYLVVVSVVVVISLVIVGVVSGFFSGVSDSERISSLASWSSKEVSLVEGIVDFNGNWVLVVRNNSTDNIFLNSVVVEDVVFDLNSFFLGSFSQRAFLFKNDFSIDGCVNDFKPIDISLSFSSRYGFERVVSDRYKFYLDCVEEVSLSESYVVFENINNFNYFLNEFSDAGLVLSLQNLNGVSDSGVVRVRRTSDNAESDFTAEQIIDGTLVDWVNTPVVNVQPDWTSTTDGWQNFAGGATAAYEASYTDSHGVTRTNIVSCTGGETNNFGRFGTSRIPGERYRITGWILSDQPGFFRPTAGGVGTEISQADTWTEMDYEVDTISASTWNFFFQSTIAESIFKITDLKIEVIKSNGAIPIWYDQRVPTTKDRMYFNGNHIFLGSVSSALSSGSDFFISTKIIFESFSGTNGRYFEASGGVRYLQFKSPTVFTYYDGTTEHEIILDLPLSTNTEYEIRVDRVGTTVSVMIDGVLQSNTATVVAGHFNVIFLGGFNRLKGSMYDVNINNVHFFRGYGNTNADWIDEIGSISGIITGANPARYFIDLSTISRDAVQTNINNQPFIVENGVLVQEEGFPAIKYNGIDNFLQIINNAVSSSATTLFLAKRYVGSGTQTILGASGPVQFYNTSNTNGLWAHGGYSDPTQAIMSVPGISWVNYRQTSIIRTPSQLLVKQNSEILRDNLDYAAANTTNFSFIGTYQLAGGNYFNGTIPEVIVFFKEINNLNELETNVINRYNLN